MQRCSFSAQESDEGCGNKKAGERGRDTETIDRNEEMKRGARTESFYTKGKVTKCS